MAVVRIYYSITLTQFYHNTLKFTSPMYTLMYIYLNVF